MKKLIGIFCFFHLLFTLFAQSESLITMQNKEESLLGDEGFLAEGYPYSPDNSLMYGINITSLLNKTDSLFVKYDEFYSASQQFTYAKTAQVFFNCRMGIAEIFIVSNLLQRKEEFMFCEALFFIDCDGYHHQLFLDDPNDQKVIQAFNSFLRKVPVADSMQVR